MQIVMLVIITHWLTMSDWSGVRVQARQGEAVQLSDWSGTERVQGQG